MHPSKKKYGRKKSHGKSNPREPSGSNKVSNGPSRKSVTARHGKKVNIKRRSHRGV